MKILPFIASATVSLLASSVTAQNLQVGNIANGAVAEGRAIVNPSNDCNKAPSVTSCWNCFQSLLSDCDRKNPEGDRRQACYQGANHYYAWCLSKVPSSSSATNDNNNRLREYDVRSGMKYEMLVPAGTSSEDVVIFVSYWDGAENKQAELSSNDYFVFETFEENMFLIVILDTNIDLSQSASIGILSAVKGDNGNIVDGFAVSANVVDSFDLNQDGVFDMADRMEAFHQHAEGNITLEQMMRIINSK